jgi:hypothetical protein
MFESCIRFYQISCPFKRLHFRSLYPSFYLQIKCWKNIEIKKKKQLSLPSRLTSIEIRQVTKSRIGNGVNRRNC